MRKEFEMSQGNLDKLLESMKPVPYIVTGGIGPRSIQENANSAWARLGREMGFEPMTVEPVRGKSELFFTAEPVEQETPTSDDDSIINTVMEVEVIDSVIDSVGSSTLSSDNFSGGGGEFGGGGASGSFDE